MSGRSWGPRNVAAAAVLDAVVATTDDAVLTLDTDGEITACNTAAHRLFGYEPDDMVGRPAETLIPDHLRESFRKAFAMVIAGDPVDHFITEIVRNDGMPVPISMSLRPAVDAEGAPVAGVLVARDITEQQLAQATLGEIETRVRESEALAHVGSWLWDVRSGAVQWSHEFHRIHGIDPLDFEGTFEAHLRTVHPGDRGRVREGMRAAAETGQPFDDEYRVRRPDGAVRRVHARAQPTVDSAGAVVGLRGIGQDVTDRYGTASAATAPDRARTGS
jgi:PAS domain S-box-containing protein